ncbi:glycosyltransferase family 4 protein [Ancylomarina sp. 16SWW S1-10-2]|uniref:glycosyltransferase family 4 protein n=1 Tax=Ancylomarina sp. 16SWW S1-10-2 TaxID=2499681 RepID=UPI0012ADE5D9|nr:glycosyltransferase family 4 protein [Ancylomarina sp. 16SWW S1-10-2]MRT91928.1 glycosyltransferase [Ancylomarina sp. 16SWW S1-10-2]
MKITFVLDTFGGGGKERRCLQLIQGLNRRGYKDIQIIIVNNNVAYRELYEADISLHIIDRKNKGLNVLQTYLSIYRLLKNFNPDIVQGWGFLSVFHLNIIRCFIGFKYIGAYVADCNKPAFFSINRLVVFLNTLLADCIIGNSNAGIEAYGIPKQKSKVIYNGFNEERYKNSCKNKEAFKNELKVNNDFIVSMIARLDNDKDYNTFIQTAKRILTEKRNIVFLVVGDGPNLLSLQKMVTEKESKFIRFLGFRSDIEEILRITNVTVLCTNPKLHKEGVSNSILESMAFGVPVVATNDGGTPEIIESGYNGFTIDAFSSKQLTLKILQIINDVSLQNKLSQGAIVTVKNKFSLNAMTEEYIELYKSIL